MQFAIHIQVQIALIHHVHVAYITLLQKSSCSMATAMLIMYVYMYVPFHHIHKGYLPITNVKFTVTQFNCRHDGLRKWWPGLTDCRGPQWHISGGAPVGVVVAGLYHHKPSPSPTHCSLRVENSHPLKTCKKDRQKIQRMAQLRHIYTFQYLHNYTVIFSVIFSAETSVAWPCSATEHPKEMEDVPC